MRPQISKVTGAGSSNPFVLDNYISPFNVGFGVVVSGTVNYTVQHTFDNVLTNSNPTWFPHPTAQAQTVNQDGNYAFPVFAIRITVNSGTGSATLTSIQAGVA